MESLNKFLNHPRSSYVAALLGALAYLAQSWHYALTQLSRLDEGLYQVKGFYFATGRFTPFEPYGPLTNHMPLSFLIPGYIQAWFGPGMAVSRVYAVVVGMLMLLGLWLTAKRLGGAWWAAAAVWAVALNAAAARTYSLGLSQGLVAAFLVWTLALTLGPGRKRWQLVLGGALAGVMVMTRINIVFILPFFILYVAWEYGWREAIWSTLAGTAVVVSLHTAFWPGIMKMWAYWVPRGWLPFLEPWYAPWRKTFTPMTAPLAEILVDLNHVAWSPVMSFLNGLRFNFIPFMGFFAALLLWPREDNWRSPQRRRMALFLAASFLLLTVMHAWAALGGNSCHLFCFSGYVFFYNPLGLLLIVVAASSWRESLPRWRVALITAFILILGAGIGLGAFSEFADAITNWNLPRFNGLLHQAGSVPLWGLLTNKFGWSLPHIRRVVGLAAGLAAGVLLLAALTPLMGKWLRKNTSLRPGYGWLALVTVLVVGMLLSPTTILGAGERTYECGTNVIESYNEVGAKLAEYIPPGAQIYWRGGNATIPLLYIPDARIFPPQMNDVFSFANTDGPHDPNELYRYGFWNEELKQDWIMQADYILVEGRHYLDEWEPMVEAGQFEVLFTTAPTEACRGDAARIVVLIPVR